MCDLPRDRCDRVVRHDFRHTHDEQPRIPNGKNTRRDTSRWCRGKAGTEHDFDPATWGVASWFEQLREQCRHCGKVRPHSYFYVRTAPTPDWAKGAPYWRQAGLA